VLGFSKCVNLDFRRAGTFFGLFRMLIIVGAAAALVPHLPVIHLLVGVQVLNGLLLPIVLYSVIRLANDAVLMADLKNTRSQNIVAGVTFARWSRPQSSQYSGPSFSTSWASRCSEAEAKPARLDRAGRLWDHHPAADVGGQGATALLHRRCRRHGPRQVPLRIGQSGQLVHLREIELSRGRFGPRASTTPAAP
jgi:hypothetical protein